MYHRPAGFVLLSGIVTAVPLWAARGAGENADDAVDKRRAAMLQRAAETKVYLLDDERLSEREPARHVPRPLFRYSDQPRDIADATLWAYGRTGRPVALQKIEYYQRPTIPRHWFYCLTSLSGGRIEVEWPDGQRWSAKRGALEMNPLPDGPAPAERKTLRLLQIKKLARRFTAEIYDRPVDIRERMRFLPRPIHRYSDPDRGLQDGVIFGFASNGTNPDLLLLIELHQTADQIEWTYGLARMTSGELDVKLDGETVFEAPYVRPAGPGRPSKFDTWLFFHEAPFETDE